MDTALTEDIERKYGNTDDIMIHVFLDKVNPAQLSSSVVFKPFNKPQRV